MRNLENRHPTEIPLRSISTYLYSSTEKPIVWMGQTYKELLTMPDNVQDDFGYALGVAQLGDVVSFAKPMKGNLRDVMEVVSNDEGDTYRAMYTTKLEGRVYVLDVFQKKARSGRATPQADLDRIELRLKAARKLHRHSST